MKLSEAVETLLVATEADGRSQKTLKDYKQKLGPLVDYLADKPADAVTVADLRSYVAHLRRRTVRYPDHPARKPLEGGLSVASVASYVRPCKRLFNFLKAEALIASNPAQRLRTPKVKRGEPKAASMDDLIRLLDAIDGDSRLARRNRALLLVLADTACRVGGLAGIRLDDLDLEAGKVYLHEKGDKGRYAFMTPMTRHALAEWLAVRPEDKGDHLFVSLGSRGENRLTAQGVREVLRRLKRKAGIQGPVNPHAWRHAFAREYLSDGGDLASLADIMGHSDVKVTWSSYAIYTQEELGEKHGAHSPVGKLAVEAVN